MEIDAVKRIVDCGLLDGKRIFTTNKKYNRFLKPKNRSLEIKPIGLWYSVGSSWIDWCIGNEYNGIGNYIYEVHINMKSNMLLIDTKDKIFEFSNNYKRTDGFYKELSTSHIEWARVMNNYDGIEINPYYEDMRLSYNLLWYYGWDVPSGCIWNKEAKNKINLIAEYDSIKKDFIFV